MMQKVSGYFFNEIEDIYSIETTSDMRLWLNYTILNVRLFSDNYVVYKTCKCNQFSHFGLIEEIMGQYH